MSKKKAKFVVNTIQNTNNKSKHKTLGKLSLRGRSKTIDKRKNTLLLEYKMKNKDNIFLDRRIGEKNRGMTQEDKVMARFAAEKVRAHSKKNIFNLNDEEILTHRGQSLMEIEKYEDPRSDEEDSDDEKSGILSKKFVEEVHFGDVSSKPHSEMSRKDMINQLIAESKKRKAEKQKIREETIDLTAKLDTEWRDLMPLLTFKKKDDEVEDKSGVDDYTKEMNRMKFEPKGMATDKLKTEEEIAKEEKSKLDALERKREERMKGFSDEAEFQQKHRSADDLDDFHIEKIQDDENEANDLEGIIKKYHEGKAEKSKQKNEVAEGVSSSEEESDEDEEENIEEKVDEEETEDDELVGEDEDEDEEEEEEEEEEGEKIGEDKDKETNKKKIYNLQENKEKKGLDKKKVVNQKNEIKEQCENDENINTDNESELEDDLSDLKATDSSDEDNDNTKSVEVSNVKHINKIEVTEDKISQTDELLEEARKELPNSFQAPNTYEELINLLKSKSPTYQSVIIERVIKSNHLKLGEGNREKLSNLFSFLVQYLNDCARVTSKKELFTFFQLFDRLCPHLYDLVHANPLSTKNCLHDILKEKHTKFEEKIKVYPDLDTIILFKLVSILYPTSDFRHPIVTPCLVYMDQILLRCKIKGKVDITKGLFLCTLVLEYTLLSKRWSPSVINFLRGIIYTALPKPFEKVVKVIPPFKTVGEMSSMLVLEKNHHKTEKNSVIDGTAYKMQTKDFAEQDIDDDFKIRAFMTSINLLSEFADQYSEIDAAYSIFEPISNLLKLGSIKRYPHSVREQVKCLVNKIDELNQKKLEFLSIDKKKPKALRMYEPRIEIIHDGKRHQTMSREKAERKKLEHKLKKETKSARRELRKDNAFLSKVKIQQQIQSDLERKRKVREIFGDAAMQQHELKKFKKKK